MTPLGGLFVIKILVTFVWVSAPFLLFRKDLLDRLSGFVGTPMVLYRLYGVAILALLAGYASGILSILEGVMPWGIVAMGLVSNGGATLVLLLTGEAKKRPALTTFFGLITVGLAASALWPDRALSPL